MIYFKKLIDEFDKKNYKMFPMDKNALDELITKKGKLPHAYVELLQLLGSGTTAPFWDGTEFFRKDILLYNLNDWAKETLEENESQLKLKKDDYVFWMSQGVLFCFFNLNDGDDPPVYLFTEQDPNKFIYISHSLSTFIWNYCFDPSIAFEEKKP